MLRWVYFVGVRVRSRAFAVFHISFTPALRRRRRAATRDSVIAEKQHVSQLRSNLVDFDRSNIVVFRHTICRIKSSSHNAQAHDVAVRCTCVYLLFSRWARARSILYVKWLSYILIRCSTCVQCSSVMCSRNASLRRYAMALAAIMVTCHAMCFERRTVLTGVKWWKRMRQHVFEWAGARFSRCFCNSN